MRGAMLPVHRNTTNGKGQEMHSTNTKRDLMIVLKERIVAISYFVERLVTIYGDQQSHTGLLAAVRDGIKHLDPVIRMLPQEMPTYIDPFVERAIGHHAHYVSEICPNAGWIVAEIDSVLSSTTFELDPVLEGDPPFYVPDSVSKEQMQLIRDCFASAAKAFFGKVNVRIESDVVVENPFVL